MEKLNCDNLRGFHNYFGSCWSIVVLTILLYSKETRNSIQKSIHISNIGNRKINITKKITELLRNHEEVLKYYYPKNEAYKKLFNKDKLFDFFYTIVDRYNYKLEEYTKTVPILRRQSSIECEENILNNFFQFIGYTKEITSGAVFYEQLFLINLLSKIILGYFILFEEYNIMNMDLNEPFISFYINIPGHAMGLFQCDDNKYKFVDNHNIIDFDFVKFKKRYQELQSKKEKFDLKYNQQTGIIIEYNDEFEYFVDNPPQYSIKTSIILIYKLKKYDGPDRCYQSINEILNYFYSIEYRIKRHFVDYNKLKEEITQVDRNYHKDGTILLDGIYYGYFNMNMDEFRYFLERFRPNLYFLDKYKKTVIDYALINKQTNIIDLFIRKQIKGIFLYLIKHNYFKNYEEFVDYITKHHEITNFNYQDEYKNTAAHYLIKSLIDKQNKNAELTEEIIEFLLKSKINIDLVDNKNMSVRQYINLSNNNILIQIMNTMYPTIIRSIQRNIKNNYDERKDKLKGSKKVALIKQGIQIDKEKYMEKYLKYKKKYLELKLS
jgi:hypothetical protein